MTAQYENQPKSFVCHTQLRERERGHKKPAECAAILHSLMNSKGQQTVWNYLGFINNLHPPHTSLYSTRPY
jgi:hypothetical protein